jgi:hypothetical protein
MIPTQDHWVERLQTVGRAQARYLWLLLIIGIFYWAVQDQMAKALPGSSPVLQVPVVDLQLSASVVLATGPAVLAFVLLAYLGAVRAFSRAAEVLELDRPDEPETESEPLDTSPNAIDLAAYTTSTTWPPITSLLYFVHPFVITAFLVEAIWLTLGVANSEHPIPGRWPWVCAGGILSFAALLRVGDTWRLRLRKVWEDWCKGRSKTPG